MKGRCDEREAQGKRNIIVLGALEITIDKRYNTKINSLIIVNTFSQTFIATIKPFESALGQPLPQILGMGWLKA